MYLLIMVDTCYEDLHSTSLHFTLLHFTCSNLNFNQLNFTTHSFGLTPFRFPTAPFHLTSLYFTSLHFQIIFATLLSLSLNSFKIAFLTLFLKILGLQEKGLNSSARSWFQFLRVLFTKEYFPIPFVCFTSILCFVSTTQKCSFAMGLNKGVFLHLYRAAKY